MWVQLQCIFFIYYVKYIKYLSIIWNTVKIYLIFDTYNIFMVLYFKN